MRIKLLSACIIATSAFGTATAVSAAPNTLERAGYIGGQGARLWYDDKISSPRLDDHALYGGQIGYRFSPRWSVELSYVEGDTERRGNNPGAERDITLPLVSGRFHFSESSFLGFEPYAGLAAGEMWVEADVSGSDKHRETIAAPELGMQTRLFRNLMLDVGARAPYSIDNDRWHGQAYAALNFLFGVRERGATQEVTQLEPTPRAEPTPPPAPAPREPQVVRRQVDETHSAQFAFDDATISAGNRADLLSAARFLNQNPQTSVTLEGHTCSIGPAEYNQYLSERRAEAARQLLTSEGVDDSRITVIGKGEREPIADNDTREGREKNRRVEAVVTGTVEERR